MNRVVRDHITSKINTGWRKRVAAAEEEASALAAENAKAEIARFESAIEALKVAREAAREVEKQVKAKGVTVSRNWEMYNETPRYSAYGMECNNTRATADAWRTQKLAEFQALELKLALSKDKLGVVEAFLATFGE